MNYIKFTQQIAILKNSTLGLAVHQNNYEILQFKAPNHWQPMPQETAFHPQHFPNNAIVFLNIDVKKTGPQIIINASGEMTSFELKVGSKKEPLIATVTGKQDGTVSLRLMDTP